MLTVTFDESTISRTQVQLWYNRFKPGSPITLTTDENIEAVKKMIFDNHRTTIRGITDDAELMPSNFYGCFGHETSGSELFRNC